MVKRNVLVESSGDCRDGDRVALLACGVESLGGVATAWELDAERPHLLGLARRLSLSPQDANDLVQDVLVRALQALGKVTGGPHLRAWMLTILRHMHVDQLRRAAREPEAVSIDEMRDTLASERPADEIADTMTADDIHRALRTLPGIFRQILVLHELEGRSYREIAHALDLPLATVGTRLSRARGKLRRALVATRALEAHPMPHAAGLAPLRPTRPDVVMLPATREGRYRPAAGRRSRTPRT